MLISMFDRYHPRASLRQNGSGYALTVSQRLRPLDLVVCEPIGLRADAPSSSLRRKLG